MTLTYNRWCQHFFTFKKMALPSPRKRLPSQIPALLGLRDIFRVIQQLLNQIGLLQTLQKMFYHLYNIFFPYESFEAFHLKASTFINNHFLSKSSKSTLVEDQIYNWVYKIHERLKVNKSVYTASRTYRFCW